MISETTVLRNRYRVVRSLGAGMEGSVFAVEDLRSPGDLPRRLALKALRPALPEEGCAVDLKHEFRVLATLRHPLLAQVHDFGKLSEHDNRHLSAAGNHTSPFAYFYTRDLIEGENLRRYARSHGLIELCELCRQIAETLHALHCAGMVHRDLKPENIIVSGDGRPHLIDFGLAQREGIASEMAGTAGYLSPELLRGERIDRRADLYALGIILYELASGRHPAGNRSFSELLSWHLEAPPVALREGCPQCPEELAQIVQRLTKRDAAQRYPSASEVAHALSGILTKLGAEPPVAGRPLFVPPAPDSSRAAFLDAVEEAVLQRVSGSDEGSAALVVAGEPGSGKSSLLRELAWRAQIAGLEVIRAAFQSGDSRPYGVLNDVLAELESWVGRPHPLSNAIALDTAEAEPAAPELGRESEQYHVQKEISDYLAGAARDAPLLVILDDLHQGDHATIQALRFIAHALGPGDPVMLIATVTDHEEAAAVLGDLPRQRLQPLSDAAIAEMLHRASGRRDEAVAKSIVDQTGGNALFVAEVLRRLAELGWPPSPDLTRVAPPHGLQVIWARRLRLLPRMQREALAAVAVFGRAAPLFALAELLSADGREPALKQALQELEASGWLQCERAERWTFRHAPARHVVEETMDPRQRQVLHSRAARVTAAEDVVESARHAVAAGDLDLSRRSLFPALKRLRSLGLHQAAIRLSTQALPLVQGTQSARRLRGELAQCHRLAGQYAEAERVLRDICESSEGDELSEGLVELARLYCAAGEDEKALAVITDLLEGELPTALRWTATALGVGALSRLDNHDAVIAAVERTSSGSGEPPTGCPPAIYADLLGHRGWSLGQLGRYAESANDFTSALDAIGSAQDPASEAAILSRFAAIAQRQGDHAQVVKRCDEALSAARRAGEVNRIATVSFNLATSMLQRGEYATCRAHLEESHQLFKATGADARAAFARCNLGYYLLKVGLYEQARTTLLRALQETQRSGLRSAEALAQLLLGLVAARREQPSQARSSISGALSIYRQLGQPRDVADALMDLAQLELEEAHPEAAQDALGRAAGAVDLEQLPELRARHSLLEARLIAMQRDAARRPLAQMGLRQAHSVAREIHSKELGWQCHAAAWSLAKAFDLEDDARAHAEAARQAIEEMAEGLPAEAAHAFWQHPWRSEIAAATGSSPPAAITENDTSLPKDSLDVTLRARRAGADQVPAGRVQLPQEERRLVERYESLIDIYRRLNAELDLERLLALVMDTAVELTGAERGFLLLGEDPADLELRVARDCDPSDEKRAFSWSIARSVFERGEPIVSLSATQDPRLSRYASVVDLRLESLLCVPIRRSGAVVGVLYLEGRRSARCGFSMADQDLLAAFGDQVGIALNNAKLLAENARKHRELQEAHRRIAELAERRAKHLAERTEELAEARRDLAETRRRFALSRSQWDMIGCSPPMLQLFDCIKRVASTDVPVLIEGESGTGKEMVARALHRASTRHGKRLVSVNCAAIPENLLESELFGHVRGAFTGADRERKGLFVLADRGTLFLDEIADMPARMQVDLLRAVQEKVIRPVGGGKEISVNVRMVTASNKPLAAEIRAGRFREDLFYRLNVVRIQVPALRERKSDIPLLVDHFLSKIAENGGCPKKQLTKGAMQRLMDYSWPGNVRQLEHALLNAAVMAETAELEADDLRLESPHARGGGDPAGAEVPTPPPPPGEGTDPPATAPGAGKQQILEAIARAQGNRSEAARILGIPRRTFYRRLKTHGLL